MICRLRADFVVCVNRLLEGTFLFLSVCYVPATSGVCPHFQVECYDYDNDGSHDLIGIFETTMTRLQEASHSSPV